MMRISALLLILGVAAPGAVRADEFLDFCSAPIGGATEQIFVQGRIAENFDWGRDCIRQVTLEANASASKNKNTLVISMLVTRPGDAGRGRLWITLDAQRLIKATSDGLNVKPVGWSLAVPTPDEELDVDEGGMVMLPPATLKFLRRYLDQAAQRAQVDIPIASGAWPREE